MEENKIREFLMEIKELDEKFLELGNDIDSIFPLMGKVITKFFMDGRG